MRFLASCLGLVMLTGCLFAQCQKATAGPPASPILPTSVKAVPAAPQLELTGTTEELDFLATGPRLYTMEAALRESHRTGKPVLCWMGKHLFSDPRARALSQELAATTIQAAMDTDGTPYDAVGYRVKFSDDNYTDAAKTYYVRLANFDKPGMGDKILAKARGGR